MTINPEIEMNYLAKLNPHERDSHITFKADTHIYTIDGVSNYLSVTSWNHGHFQAFDSDKIIDNMMKSKNWGKSKYFGMTKEEIKSTWDKSKNSASGEGTKLHYDIECYYNNCPNKNESIEYEYFLKFAEDYKHLKPYRTEWMIFDEDLKLAGSIDMVYENPDGTLSIYDWKRSKDISKINNWDKFAINPLICHMPDSNFWHYALQLNTYKSILERKYNKIVTKLCLVRLHPNNEEKTYELLDVPILTTEILELFKEREKQVKRT